MGACMLGAVVRRNFLGRRIGTLGDLEQLHYLSTEFLDFAAEYADLDSFLFHSSGFSQLAAKAKLANKHPRRPPLT